MKKYRAYNFSPILKIQHMGGTRWTLVPKSQLFLTSHFTRFSQLFGPQTDAGLNGSFGTGSRTLRIEIISKFCRSRILRVILGFSCAFNTRQTHRCFVFEDLKRNSARGNICAFFFLFFISNHFSQSRPKENVGRVI